MTELNQIERIKIKLTLAKNTDCFFEVFGASSHKYIIGKPIDSEKISDFEKKYNLTLPLEYKKFLTLIGNGGINYENSVVGNSCAGPGYGIFELGHFYQFITEPSLKYHEKEPFFNENMTEENWMKIYDEIEDNVSDEEYENILGKAYSRILNIGYSGCSNYLSIILNGKNSSRVIESYEEIEYCPRLFQEMNYLDWYENWLDRIISGEEIWKSDFFSQSETESNIVQQFVSDLDDEYWQFKRLGYLRKLEKLSQNSIKLLWEKYKQTDEINQKSCLLNFLTKFDYENTTEEILKYSNRHPLTFLRNLHLYCREKTYKWDTNIKLIKIQNQHNKDVIDYIQFITEEDLKNYG